MSHAKRSTGRGEGGVEGPVGVVIRSKAHSFERQRVTHED